jgi:hypothetical protein
MITLKKILLLALITISIGSAKGQNNRNYSSNKLFWSEIGINGPIKNKFGYGLDIQYRRRAFGTGNLSTTSSEHNNIFQTPFQYVLRPWINYNYSPNLRFSISPLGAWFNFKDDSPKAGVPQSFQPELRICGQVTFSNEIGRVSVTQRVRYEYRMFGIKEPLNGGEFNIFDGYSFNTTGYGPKQRVRVFMRANIPLQSHSMKEMQAHQFYISIFDEVFISAGANVGNNIFDQNRFLTSLGYKIAPDVRVEVGYLNQLAFQNVGKTTVQDVYKNNVLQFYLFLDNFSKFFKKKEEPKS